ncbi:hypothetical protein BGZ50_008068 [Haplosporangium sp. Z 11]|nr:hypothetical protein BGZ50_008068 [Haplosporangium sp. Z 11]
MRIKPLTLLQRQRITLSLFFTVAVGAVFTVAAPAFVPWQVVDEKRAQALDQQRRQGKNFHVIENHSRPTRSDRVNDQEQEASDPSSIPSTPSSVSSQGPIIALLTDRSKQGNDPSSSTNPSIESIPHEANDPSTPTKKRKRRRKRKMVNEGWQELTGRTAREEKERQHALIDTKDDSHGRTFGENGGLEINWKNKAKS